MAKFKRFEDMLSWKKSRELTRLIYEITKNGKFSRDFNMRDQIRSAALSIMSNIVEGFERHGNNEFIQFLSIAKGSAGEVRSQLYAALDQEYIDEQTFNKLYKLANEVGGLIGGLMDYLKNSKIRGVKYQKAL